MLTGRVNAPEINTRHGWLNTDRDYTLKDFRGKVVLLDFWTFGCINCQHLLPDLKRLEQEYPTELVVIGVHSAKFDAEKRTAAIRQAILKFGISHPVVNDADFEVWKQYAVNAWPTVVLIDPNGKVVGQKSGEGIYDIIKPYLEELIQTFGDRLNRDPLPFIKEKPVEAPLRFPSKLMADDTGHLYLADSGHHRLLRLTPQGQVVAVIGSGRQGFTNGGYAEAQFNEPHGLALHGQFLYVADAKNNAIRKVNLATRQVTTVAGTGELSYYFFYEQVGVPVNPNSPWDLAVVEDQLYIASAGNHQLLRLDLATEKVFRFAGTGREALADGPLPDAAFNQPSGLALINHTLYVADPEASAVRAVDLCQGTVTTLIGRGLFEFGDEDGDFDEAYLQHCLGIAAHAGNLFLADTYNGKIKFLDLERQRIKTIVSGLEEPNDVLVHQGYLWITNTNAHELWRVHLETWEREVVDVRLPL
ncbi:thioredoxin-like domain-containing protein [Rufibacter quisquiliarum]|uniref:Thiol-disulfide isomerase/thioredoxin/sugar lactone lactonase YvrE n=1 Tax=Rufibacter quisquiliarum TaxID=1549639 RepID=A0A839GF78_9BACT|nr:thioredoxin-like domain-containing protein [Rufibacter quisquiliarum]MBA9076203.1 thiol-disulfide isomerase/thioredoxin/sugar lactone lactonase YvrE [Rufibacter quisquiliarum]